MQKTYLFSLQIGMPQANALNSIGYTDTVPFLTIGKPDIILLKSLGKLATVFIRVTNNYRNWLPTYLIFFCDRNPAYQYPATVHLPHYQ
jgi:hypothetical protein